MRVFIAIVCLVLASCDASVETVIKGDRDVVQVTTGKFNDGCGGAKDFFIVRDTTTGVDYLVIIDAGIVRLDPNPAVRVER